MTTRSVGYGGEYELNVVVVTCRRHPVDACGGQLHFCTIRRNQHAVERVVTLPSSLCLWSPFSGSCKLSGMDEFISEVIMPCGEGADTRAMAMGEPGLPAAFRWRGELHRVEARLKQWKDSAPEGGRAGGELYLRRHYYELQMSDHSFWTVYFARQPSRGGVPEQRWFLYKRRTATANESD